MMIRGDNVDNDNKPQSPSQQPPQRPVYVTTDPDINDSIAERLLYGKLQDELFFLGNNAIIKINVMLYKILTRVNKREYFYREYQYVNKGGNLVRTLNRTIDVFLSIENLKSNGIVNKEYMTLRARDLELLRIGLLPKLEYIVTHMNEIYKVRNQKIYIDEDIKAMEVTLCSNEKSLFIKPGVHKLYNDELAPCLEVYLNSPRNLSIMSIPNVYELMYFIRVFNIYQYASSMLAYFGPPPNGFNMYDYTIDQDFNSIESYKYEEPESIKNKRDASKGFFANQLRKKRNEDSNKND